MNESTSFEQEFSNMAYALLQDTLPELMEYNVGFEVADSNDAKTNVTGIFGFKINGRSYVAPAKFINNELKPIMHIIDVEDNEVLPLNSDFLSMIKRKNPPKMGHGVKADVSKFPAFNMRNLMVYPFTDKYAGFKESRKYCEKINPRRNLATFLHESPSGIKRAFLEACKSNRNLFDNCLDIYGEEVMKFAFADVEREKKASRKSPGYEIIDHNSSIEKKARLSKKEKTQLEWSGMVIRDCRDVNGKPIQYTETYSEHSFSSPCRDGIYRVTTNKGEIKAAIFLDISYFHTKSNVPNTCVIVDIESRSWCVYDPSRIVLRTDEIWDIPEDFFTTIKSVNNKSGKNNNYMLYEELHDRKRVYEPFRVDKKVKSKKGDFFTIIPNYEFRGHSLECGYPPSRTRRPKEYPQDKILPGRNFDEAILCVKSGGKISHIGSDLLVPKDTKVVILKEMDLMVIGTPDIDTYTFDGFQMVKASSRQLIIDNKVEKTYLNKRAAVEDLMLNMGLYGPNALQCVETEQPFLIKRANNPFFNYMNTAMDGYVDAPGGEEQMQIEEFPLGELGSYDAINYNQVNEINEDIEKAMQMSSMGMKRIFDHSLIGTLGKMTDISQDIRSYIPDIYKSIDALGRITMQLWNNYDIFQESFGLNEVSEFEELLKDTFNNLGEIVIHLENKAIGKEKKELA